MMTAEKLKKFEELLLEKRRKLLHELGYLESNNMSVNIRDSAGNYPYSEHMADQGTDTMEREEAFSLVNREGRFLYHIDKALERIKEGNYGICVECNEPIGLARLEAVPHARLCIKCKSAEENEQKCR